VIPVPDRPLVPVPNPPKLPDPVAPKPPGPADPIPLPPKPQDPVPQPPKPDSPPQSQPKDPVVRCKRAVGGDCVNIAKFDTLLELFREKGENALKGLNTAQKVEAPKDVSRVSVATIFKTRMYEGSQGLLHVADPILSVLSAINITYSTNEDWRKSIMEDKDDKNETSHVFMETYERPQDGAIVISDSNKVNNKSAQDSLQWSDMVMLNWRLSCRADKNHIIGPDTLKYMIISNISGDSGADQTRNLIDVAINQTKGDPAKLNTFRGDPDIPDISSDEIGAYQLLAGSPYGQRVVTMLVDYGRTMRNVRVYSFSATTEDMDGADSGYNLIVKFVKTTFP
jgi:hypothetical protein